MPRAHWNGYLKLSLVSCPISLFPAVSAAEKVSFRRVNRETGNRLRQQLVDTVTGEVVEQDRSGRGYEVGENQFLLVQDEELEAARQEARTRPFSSPPSKAVTEEPAERPRQQALTVVPAEEDDEDQVIPATERVPRPIVENTRTIELDRFIPREQIDPRYYNTPHYIAPRDPVGLEAFSVIRDAMTRQGLVGMGRVVLSNRERPLFIEPMGVGLRGITLRYAHEVRSEEEYFASIPNIDIPDDVIEVTEHILNLKREDFDAAYLEDKHRTVLVEKLRQKRAPTPSPRPQSAPSRANVINLMDALKRSLGDQKPPAASRTQPRSTAKRRPAQPKVIAKRPKARRTE